MHILHKKNKKNTDPVFKYYNSLGYYLISRYGNEAVKLYWSDKNEKSPFEYDKGSGKAAWFKCVETDYHDDYQTIIFNFTGNSETRCPMCASKNIHPKDSFG